MYYRKMTNTKQETLKEKIQSIKEDIQMMKIVRPGSISKQYNVCGKLTCACKDKEHPKKHGPYYVLSYRHRGKTRTEFIRQPFVADVEEWTDDYKRLWKMIDKWIDFSIKLSKLEMKDSDSSQVKKNPNPRTNKTGKN